MKRINIIFLLWCLFSIASFSQGLTMSIKVIGVYYANVDEYMTYSNPVSGIYDRVEGVGFGPSIYFDCVLKNETNDTIYLCPKQSKTYLHFNFQDREYTKHAFSVPFKFYEMEKTMLLPNQEFEIMYYALNYLYYAGISEEKKGNYLLELCEILPTIRLEYTEKDRDISVFSSKILKVNVYEFDEHDIEYHREDVKKLIEEYNRIKEQENNNQIGLQVYFPDNLNCSASLY